jgi:hypothetical protein
LTWEILFMHNACSFLDNPKRISFRNPILYSNSGKTIEVTYL